MAWECTEGVQSPQRWGRFILAGAAHGSYRLCGMLERLPTDGLQDLRARESLPNLDYEISQGLHVVRVVEGHHKLVGFREQDPLVPRQQSTLQEGGGWGTTRGRISERPTDGQSDDLASASQRVHAQNGQVVSST